MGYQLLLVIESALHDCSIYDDDIIELVFSRVIEHLEF